MPWGPGLKVVDHRFGPIHLEFDSARAYWVVRRVMLMTAMSSSVRRSTGRSQGKY
jgi:hypothetical protein